MPPPYPKTQAITPADDWQQLAAGTYDFTDGTNGPPRCAREIILTADGDLTHCFNAAGVDKPLTGLLSGFSHRGHTKGVTCTGGIIVYW